MVNIQVKTSALAPTSSVWKKTVFLVGGLLVHLKHQEGCPARWNSRDPRTQEAGTERTEVQCQRKLHSQSLFSIGKRRPNFRKDKLGDGSEANGVYCFHRGPEVGSWHPHQWAHISCFSSSRGASAFFQPLQVPVLTCAYPEKHTYMAT